MQLHEQKEMTYSHEYFHSISVLLLRSCLDMNKKINKIYEKVLRLVYKDETNLSFDELLEKDKLISIHRRNLQILMKKCIK